LPPKVSLEIFGNNNFEIFVPYTAYEPYVSCTVLHDVPITFSAPSTLLYDDFLEIEVVMITEKFPI
jgi:hypothetical protein